MEFTDLEYFICVSELGNFSKASSLLHVSQPAISCAIKRLENEFSIALMDRSTRTMKLTKAGLAFYEKAKLIIKERNRTVSYMRSLSAPQPESIRIGISPFYSKYYLPPFLNKLKEIDGLKLSITESISANLEEGLMQGDIDICFIPLEPINPFLSYKILCIEEILVAIPKSFDVNNKAIQGKGLSYIELKELQDLPFVSLKQIQKISKLINTICLEAGFTPDVVYETLDWDTVNIMIANGIGVGFVPDILYQEDTGGGRKVPNYYKIANRHVSRHYAAAWPKGKVLTPMQLTVIELFRKSLAEYRPTIE